MNTKQKTSFALLLVALSIGIAGCSIPINTAQGTKIEQSKLSQITRGVTTRQQIEQLFGQPTNVNLSPDGKRTMVYTYTANQGSAGMGFMGFSQHGDMNMTRETLQVIVTKDGIVEDFEFNDSSERTKSNVSILGATTESNPTK